MKENKNPGIGNLIPLIVYGENQFGTVNCNDIIHYCRNRQNNDRWPIKYFDVEVSPSVSTNEYIFLLYDGQESSLPDLQHIEHIKTSLNLVSNTKIPVILLSCLRKYCFLADVESKENGYFHN